MFELSGASRHNHSVVPGLGQQFHRGFAVAVDLDVGIAQLSDQPTRSIGKLAGAVDPSHPGDLATKLTGAFNQGHLVSAPRGRECGPQTSRP